MLPWLDTPAVPAREMSHIRRRAIFDCCKWDAQVEDVNAIAPQPIVLTADAWDELSRLAEQLAAEIQAAETELLQRPDLHERLGLPRALRRALRDACDNASPGAARLIRFDFHYTTDGWCISEANTDVPGGINEAAGFPALFQPHYPDTRPAGDPAAALVGALRHAAGADARVALLHATAYSDDVQVMTYLARRLEHAGMSAVLASPAHVRWARGAAVLDMPATRSEVDVAARFFPAEWLPGLPARCGWATYFAGARTPASNPGAALLTQSKRLPLVWHELRTPMPTWQALLPETCDPRAVTRGPEWLLKPAFGRIGEGIALEQVVPERECSAAWRAARRRPREWVAQRRFEAVAMQSEDAPLYPCVGVYTVDGRTAGAYGRVATRPLLDWRAQDAAVLVRRRSDA